MKKSIIGKVPNFSQIRSELLADLSYPVAIAFNESGYESEIARLNRLCTSLNQIALHYGSMFKYNPGLEEFKRVLLPLIISIPTFEVLEKKLRTAWLIQNNISVEIRGAILNRQKSLNFLLDTVEFPVELTKEIQAIPKNVQATYVPTDFQYVDLYNDVKHIFEISKENKEIVKENNTHKIGSKKVLTKYLLALQLCDCLNALKKVDINVPPEHIGRSLR